MHTRTLVCGGTKGSAQNKSNCAKHMELAGQGKMVSGMLRKYKGETAANSSGSPSALNYLLISKSQAGREHIKEGEGDKSQGDLGSKGLTSLVVKLI